MTAPAVMRVLTAGLVALAVAGCGGSSSSEETPASSDRPDAAAITELQEAAADLVRESDYKDAPGAERALKELQEKLTTVEDGLPEEPAKEIEAALSEAKEAVEGKDFEEANEAAKETLEAVNEAAAQVTGTEAGPVAGIKGQLTQLKAAARDMTREIENGDKPGSQRAYAAFKDLFAKAEEPIEEKSHAAAEAIERALDRVRDDLPSKDPDELEEAGEELAGAVDAAAAKLGVKPPG